MFSARDVDRLFSQAGKLLQRSQAMLDERYGNALSATTTTTATMTVSTRSNSKESRAMTPASFAPTLRALHELAQLRDYLAGCVELVDRTVEELTNTTRAVSNGAKKKAREPFALVRRLSYGLQPDFVAPCAQASHRMTREAQLLWWPACATSAEESTAALPPPPSLLSLSAVSPAGREDEVHGGEASATTARTTTTAAMSGCAAGVASAVLRAGFYAEAHRQLANTGSSGAAMNETCAHTQRVQGDGLYKALHHAAQFLPPAVMDDLLGQLVQHLVVVEGSSACPPPCVQSTRSEVNDQRQQQQHIAGALPGMSLLCFPDLIAYVMLHGPHKLLSACVFQPLARLSASLLPRYRASMDNFTQSCGMAVGFVVTLTTALLQRMQTLLSSASSAPMLSSAASSSEAAELQRRGQRVLRQLHETFLHPLETQFVDANARPGMAQALQHALVQPYSAPLQRLLQTLLLQERGGTSSNSNNNNRRNMQSWARPLLCTALYRALLVIETVARAELRVQRSDGDGRNNNDNSSAAAHEMAQDEAWRQTRYQSLLKAAHGKMSTTLLRTIAEDRQMLLEAMPGLRSASGHKLYKLHGLDESGEERRDERSAMPGPRAKQKALYVYVDDGIIHYKQPRMRAFQAATSVEEVFAHLA